MYLPPTTIPSTKAKVVRVGLQGEPATGKTYSSLTFPNPIVGNLDNGLSAFPGTPSIPFYDPEFICSLNNGKFKPKSANEPPLYIGRMSGGEIEEGALLWWLRTEGLKLEADQTYIHDSWSSTQDALDTELWLKRNAKVSHDGKIDDRAPWGNKGKISKEIMKYLCSLRCNVVVIFHEIQQRNDKPPYNLLDKTKPLMQGAFVAEIKRFFTDYFRTVTEEILAQQPDGKHRCVEVKYFWQVRSDHEFDARSSISFPSGIVRTKPHYDIFKEYAT